MGTLLSLLTFGSYNNRQNNRLLQSLVEEKDEPTVYLLTNASNVLRANIVQAASAENKTLFSVGNVTILAPNNLPPKLEGYLTEFFSLYDSFELVEEEEGEDFDAENLGIQQVQKEDVDAKKLGFEIVGKSSISAEEAKYLTTDVEFRALLDISSALLNDEKPSSVKRLSLGFNADQTEVDLYLTNMSGMSFDNVETILQDAKHIAVDKAGIPRGNPSKIRIVSGEGTFTYEDGRTVTTLLYPDSRAIQAIEVKDAGRNVILEINYERTSIKHIVDVLVKEYKKTPNDKTGARLGKARSVLKKLITKRASATEKVVLRKLLTAIENTSLPAYYN